MQERVKAFLPHRPNIIPMRELLTFSNILKLTAICAGLGLLLYFNYAQAADIKGDPILMMTLHLE